MAHPEPPTPRTAILADLVGDLVADAEAAYLSRQEGRPLGPITSLPEVDEALGGFLAPGVHVVQAAPGAGKTAWCLQVAAECGFPALYVTAEMPLLELFRRIVSRTTNTFLGRLRGGELTPGEVKSLALTAAKRVPRLAIMDGTAGYAHPGDYILPAAEALRDRFEVRSLLVIIDALQPWARSGGGGGETEYDLVNAGLTAAQGLGTRLGCPILCVSHRNRMGQKSGGLHASKGSGDVEYASESILELTPKGDVSMMDGTRKVDLEIHKNRHGQAGLSLSLEFEGRLQRFREG